MSVINITVNGGWQPCSLRIELDGALANENTILGFLNAGLFYEPDVSEVMSRVLRGGDTFIDVGANIGFFTLLAAALVGPTGRVVSFEPDPQNCARLRHNIELNNFQHVTVVEQPVTDAAGPVNFFINSDDRGGSALWDPAKFPGNVRSQATPEVLRLVGTTIDAEVERLGLSRVKLLKIDVEGAEPKCLRGAHRLLASRGVPYIVAELHAFGLEQSGSNSEAFRGEMATAGYDSFMLYYDGTLPRFLPRQTAVGSPCLCNILFSSAENIAAYWPVCMHDPRKL